MPFPIDPDKDQDPLEFLIQDPFGVRESIFPLLTVNVSTGRLAGLGTMFSADPFGGYVTAQHIFSEVDLTSATSLDPKEKPIAMLNPGLVFGSPGLSKELYAPLTELFGFAGKTAADPLQTLLGKPASPSIIVDCLKLSIKPHSAKQLKNVKPLPIRCSNQSPKPGDRLLAIGFPELGEVKDVLPDTYCERMYGAIGKVVAVHPSGFGAARPWPIIEVNANWRAGMSGGPIFNESGEVVGLVSSSIGPSGGGVGVGFGLWFGGFPVGRIVTSLDPSNPGYYRCFGVLRSSPWHLAGVYTTHELASAHAGTLGSGYKVLFGTHRYGTDDFITWSLKHGS